MRKMKRSKKTCAQKRRVEQRDFLNVLKHPPEDPEALEAQQREMADKIFESVKKQVDEEMKKKVKNTITDWYDAKCKTTLTYFKT